MIYVEEHGFDQVEDQVKTEQTVYEKLSQHGNEFKHLNYVALPLVHLLNTKDLQYTQRVIDIIEKKRPGKKTYVCQHIYVRFLNFYNNTVYTPHATSQDNYRVIPHYNPCVVKDNYIHPDKRIYNFSFIGAFKTHPIRKELSKVNLSNTVIRDTGDWHFYKKDRREQTKQYVDILCNTKYALCPPGTGPSTIRLYEAMAAGCVPIVFNDVKVPDIIADHVIRVTNLQQLASISTDIHDDTCENIYKIYWKHLSNDNYYKLLK